jgi:hypothetical protein
MDATDSCDGMAAVGKGASRYTATTGSAAMRKACSPAKMRSHRRNSGIAAGSKATAAGRATG